jgi:fucose 4-O-acetylase-like acetyltransferase
MTLASLDVSLPPSPSPAQRHQGLDALRGLLMVTVILGHFPTSQHGRNPFGPLPGLLYFFHIPLFLALSCLFAKPFTLSQLRNRTLQILVPYAAWMALTHPSLLVHHPWTLLGDAAMGNYARVPSILWFLPALFTTNLLMALWRRDQGPGAWSCHLGLLLLVLAALASAPTLVRWHPHLPFGLDVALYLFPFLWLLEQLWRRRQVLTEATGPWLVPVACLALPLGGLLIQHFERVKTHSAFARRIDFAQFSVPETLPGYLGMTLMAAALLVLTSRLPAPRWLATVGRYSMPIFLLHYLLLFLLTRCIGLAGESQGWLLLFGLGVTALVIALAMGVARLLTWVSPRFALLGLRVARTHLSFK